MATIEKKYLDLEGLTTYNTKVKELINDKVAPKNRNEEEIAGYRDVLELIHENYDNIPITSSFILQLHKILYRYSSSFIGGKFNKCNSNLCWWEQS